MGKVLNEIRPRTIIMYDADVGFVRQTEVRKIIIIMVECGHHWDLHNCPWVLLTWGRIAAIETHIPQ